MCSPFRSLVCPCLRCFAMFSPSLFRTSLTLSKLNSFTFRQRQRLSAAFKAKLRKLPLLPKVTTGNPGELEMRIRAHLMDTESQTGLTRLSCWFLWISLIMDGPLEWRPLFMEDLAVLVLLFSASF